MSQRLIVSVSTITVQYSTRNRLIMQPDTNRGGEGCYVGLSPTVRCSVVMQGASSKFHLSQLPWLNFELLILNSIALLEFDIRQNLGMMPIICRRCGASCRICGRWLDAAACLPSVCVHPFQHVGIVRGPPPGNEHAREGQMYLTVNAICYTAFQQCD